MFVLQAWGIVLIRDFPSLPSGIGSTAPSCSLGVDPASFLNSSLAFLEYIIIKLPEKDYARDKLLDSMNSQKYLYLAISLKFLTGKVKPLKHLNRGSLTEKIGCINNGRTKKPNKGKGNPIITDCGHSQSSLGWRDKARGGVQQIPPLGQVTQEKLEPERTHSKGQIPLQGEGWEGLGGIISWYLHSSCALSLLEPNQKAVKEEPGNRSLQNKSPAIQSTVEERQGIYPRAKSSPHSYLIYILA